MSGLLLVTPLRVEALCARKGAPGAVVWRTGMGRRRSLGAAGELVAAAGGAGAEVAEGWAIVLGLAGGLRSGQRAGEVIVADTLALAPGESHDAGDPMAVPAASALAGALESAGLAVSTGTVVSASRLANGPVARAAVAAGGALAVDMESWWLAGAGGPVPPRLAVVRVLSDAPGQELVSLRTPPALVRAFRVLVRVARALQAAAPAIAPRPTEVMS